MRIGETISSRDFLSLPNANFSISVFLSFENCYVLVVIHQQTPSDELDECHQFSAHRTFECDTRKSSSIGNQLEQGGNKGLSFIYILLS
jgi:hypothetical protein